LINTIIDVAYAGVLFCYWQNGILIMI